MEDEDLMPWGKFQGTRMIDIPADYLLYLLNEGECHGEVKTYILENKDVLEMEVKEKKKY